MILATNNKSGIGLNNTIPWHSTEDFKHFKKETTGKIVVMGFNTWKSLPRKPLPGRLNIVLLSRDYKFREEVDSDPSVLFLQEEDLWHIISNNPDCVVIGGSRLYRLALPLVDEVVLSIIDDDTECDTFFDLDSESYSHNLNMELTTVKDLDDGTIVEYWRIIKG